MSQLPTPTVVLCCTDCQHVFEPDLVATLSNTGCERCGGWTWIAQSEPLQLPRPRRSQDHSPNESPHLDIARRAK